MATALWEVRVSVLEHSEETQGGNIWNNQLNPSMKCLKRQE